LFAQSTDSVAREQCEAAGVNIFRNSPSRNAYDENDCVVGVRTGDKGIDKEGKRKQL